MSLSDYFKKLFANKNLVVFLILCFVSLITLTWYNGDSVLGSGDNFISIDLYKHCKNLNSSWNAQKNGGSIETNLQYHLPYSLFFYPARTLGLSRSVSQKIWMWLSLLLPGYAMYLFLYKFFDKKISWELSLAASLFYLFNPVTMIRPLGIVLPEFPVYLGMPLIGYIIISIFKEKEWGKKYLWALYLSLSTLLLPSFSRNIAEGFPLFVTVVFLFIYYLILSKQRMKHVLLFMCTLVLSILLNVWWLITSFYGLFAISSDLVPVLQKFGGKGPKIFDALRLMGFWALSSNSDGIPYYTYGVDFYTKGGVFQTYVITLISFVGLSVITFDNFVKRNLKIDKVKIFFIYTLVFLSIFLLKGANPPWGIWFSNLRNAVPIFSIFREPYSKFILLTLFSYTIALCLGLYITTKLVKKYLSLNSLVVIMVFIPILLGVSYPMFTGEIIKKTTYGPQKQGVIKVPSYWEEIDHYTNKNPPKGRVLVLPKNDYYKKSFVWESGFVGSPQELFLNGSHTVFQKADIDISGEYAFNHLYNTLENYILNGEDFSLIQFLNLSRLLNISHILQMNDFDYLNYGRYRQWSAENMSKFYTALSKNISQEKSWGNFSKEYLLSIPHVVGGEGYDRSDKHATQEDYLNHLLGRNILELYAFDDSLYKERIYVPSEFVYYRDFEHFLELLEDEKYLSTSPVFTNEGLDVLYGSLNASPASASISKLSDTRYKVTLNSIDADVIPLVFSETFHPEWKVGTGCTWLRCKGDLGTNHTKANMFANFWIIDSEEIPSNNQFYIYHASEFRLKFGLLVSIVSLFATGMFIFRLKKGKVH